MKTYTKKELTSILNLHKKWLNGEKGGIRIDLRNTNLSFTNLSNSNLRGSNLSNSDLSGSDLSNSDLSNSDFSFANLSFTNLSFANLSNSDLCDSNLCGSDLSNSDLSFANLRYAELRNANLSNSDFSGSNLSDCDLSNANIEGAKFSFPVTLPEGQFDAWKKVKDKNGNQFILKLIIPADAERISTPIGRKCRTSKAFVDSAWDLEGNRVWETIFYSTHNRNFIYKIGKEVIEPNYDSDIRVECTSGIHFFVTEEEAREY